jgi:hypothetical protein
MQKFLAIFLCLLIANPVWATDYYISPTGSDGAGCGEETDYSDACATIDYVVDTHGANRGDTIYLKDGTYLFDATTPANTIWAEVEDMSSGSGYLVIRAQTIGGVTVDGQEDGSGYMSDKQWDRCMEMDNSTGVKIMGINFTRCGAHGIRMAGGSRKNESHDIWVDQCTFYNIGAGYSFSDIDADPYDGRLDFCGITGFNYSTGSTSPIKVTRSEFYNIGRQPGTNNYAAWDHDVYGTGYFEVENCVFHDPNSGYQFKFRGGYSKLYNNTFVRNAGKNERPALWNADGVKAGNVIANNLFINMGQKGSGATPPSAPKVIQGITSDTIASYYSWYNNYTTENLDGSSGAWEFQRNASTNWAACSGNSVNNSAASFDFTDMSADDYSIGVDSIAKDKALAAYAPALDFIGTERPQGSADDIGAYEYY